MSYIIREYMQTDLEALAQVYVLSYADDVWNEKWRLEDAQNRIAEITGTPESISFVCVDNAEIVGGVLCTLMSWHTGKQLEVKEFFISPQHQNRGIGSALMMHIDTLVPKLDISEVFLWTKNNQKLIGLYKKCGYLIIEDTVELTKKNYGGFL